MSRLASTARTARGARAMLRACPALAPGEGVIRRLHLGTLVDPTDWSDGSECSCRSADRGLANEPHSCHLGAVMVRQSSAYRPSLLSPSDATSGRSTDRKVEIVASARGNPVTYRRYDPTNLIKAFPDFRFRSLEDGIASVSRAASEAGVASRT